MIRFADDNDIGRSVVYCAGHRGAEPEVGIITSVERFRRCIFVKFHPVTSGIDIPGKACRPEDLTWLSDLLKGA